MSDVTLEGGPLDGRVIRSVSGCVIVMPLVTDGGLIYSAAYRRCTEARAELDHYQWLEGCPACRGEREVKRRKRDARGKMKLRKCLDCYGFGSVSVRGIGAPGSGRPVERAL